jgi:hypothetical protein
VQTLGRSRGSAGRDAAARGGMGDFFGAFFDRGFFFGFFEPFFFAFFFFFFAEFFFFKFFFFKPVRAESSGRVSGVSKAGHSPAVAASM